MAMQKIEAEAPKSDLTFFEFGASGSVLEGYYIGSETFEKDGDELTRHLFNINGEKNSILGGKVLDDRLSKVAKGALTRVTFNGFAKSKTGRKYRLFDVEFDPSDISVAS